ncbi:regulator of chromosome condensation 1/beta-lactamase-inhibitor protein II [Xylaria venustula]|nr:regulator of chromosome condensation 1/beta-lactamase-inhibitor protein II [Xylaria venustula]
MGRPKSSASGASKRVKKDPERVPTVGSKDLASNPKKTRVAKEARISRTAASPPTTSGSAAKRKRAQSEEPITADTTSSNKRPRTGRTQKGQAKGRSAKPQESEQLAPPPVLNKVPEEILTILVFGGGENGELGLGPKRNEALRPVLNPFLDPSSPTAYHIVDFACGGMHTVALSAGNQIITWGVNDNKALGRNTDWDGGLRDVDADSDDEDDENLNPLESTPTEIPAEHFTPGTRFAQVAAGDSCSFALTDTGLVYGWGTFRNSQGNNCFGYDTDGEIITTQATPVQIRGLPKITQIVCGSNHALALDTKGSIWAWGWNEQNQFGRHLFGRQQDSFVPSQVRVCRGNVKYIASGEYHSFAIDRQDNVWAWGANSYGEAGDPETAGSDSAVLRAPVKIRHLCKKGVTTLAGGAHHSAAVTAEGQCLVWGRIDAGQLGVAFTPEQIQDENHIRCDDRGKPRICLRPTAVPTVEQAVHVACGTDHTIFINKSGAAYSSGFGFQGQLGLASNDDVEVATLIGGKAIKSSVLIRAGAGGNVSVVAGFAESD